MLNDLDNGMSEVISPDKLVKFVKGYDNYDYEWLKVYHYGSLILTLYENGCHMVGGDAYSDTDVRIINQVLEHYKIEKVAHRHKDYVFLE